jgi:hypothetical protein
VLLVVHEDRRSHLGGEREDVDAADGEAAVVVDLRGRRQKDAGQRSDVV